MIIVTDSTSFRELLYAICLAGQRLMVKNQVTDVAYWITPNGSFSFNAVKVGEGNVSLSGECVDGYLRIYETVDIKGPSYPVGNFTVHIYPAVELEVNHG